MKKFISFLSAVLISLTALLPTTAFADEVDNILSRVENYFNTGYYYEAQTELNWLYYYHSNSLTYGRDKTAEYYSSQVKYAIKYMDKVFAWFDKIDNYYNRGLYYEANDELTWLYNTYNLTPSQLNTWNKKKANVDMKIGQINSSSQSQGSSSHTSSVSSWFSKIDNYYSNGYYYEARDELTWLKDTYSLTPSQLSSWNEKRDKVNYAIKYMDKVFNWFSKVENYYNRQLYYEARDELTWLKDTYQLTPSQSATWDKWKTAINNKINAYETNSTQNNFGYYTINSDRCEFKYRTTWNHSSQDGMHYFFDNTDYPYCYAYSSTYDSIFGYVYDPGIVGAEVDRFMSNLSQGADTTLISKGYERINGYNGYQVTFSANYNHGADKDLYKAWVYFANNRMYLFMMLSQNTSSWPDELYKAFYETLGSVNFY